LQCSAPDTVFLRARDGLVTMNDLLKATMRLRPDRIVVGEVRGCEALSLLKAWNTGHPGGLSTVHANSARGGLTRLEQLVQEAVITGTHGLYLEKNFSRGVLLPNVAVEHQWDGETFLNKTALKAGLKEEDWKEGTDVCVFTTQVFEG
jgi:hypothetical protein